MHRSLVNSARKQLARHNLLIQRAAQHRASPTPAERALWSALRGKQLGAWFRRQYVLGPYIVDFVALTPRLVVEVDGDSHRFRPASDAHRDRWLAAQGYRVLRVTNHTVLTRLPDVAARIRQALAPRARATRAARRSVALQRITEAVEQNENAG